MKTIERMLSHWNWIANRESKVYQRADIAYADELIQKLRKETDLHKGQELKACTKYLNNTVYEQMVAIGKEFQEVHYAYMAMHESWTNPNSKGQEAYRNELIEELVDLQTACQTLLVILVADIDKVRHEVIVKNAERGYFDRK
ncbi:MAG: hypothetical protein P4N59_29495 [Negativicutes bacterium]|nr:hypothetical protein [Negativicutes bacterium]